MEIRYLGKSNANSISSMEGGNAKNSSERNPEILVDEQFSMWFALAKRLPTPWIYNM